MALAAGTALGFSTLRLERGPAGHEDNVRRADQIVAANIRPGDAVIYDTPADENLVAAYPYGLAQLASIAQYQSPIASGTCREPPCPPRRSAADRGAARLWVIEVHHRTRLPVLQGLGLRQLRVWHTADLWCSSTRRAEAGLGLERSGPPVAVACSESGNFAAPP